MEFAEGRNNTIGGSEKLDMTLSRLLEPLTAYWLNVRQRFRPRARARRVELPRYGVVEINVSLGFVGDNCLRTNLLTKRALDRAPAGAIIEIASDNLSAVETIPFMLENHDCTHVITVHEQECWKIYVRKREK